jgi:hypothetical protein
VLHYHSISEPFEVLWAILQHGAPCRVTIFQNVDRVVLAYPKLSIQIAPIDGRISPLSHVDYMTTVENNAPITANLCNPGPALGPTFVQTKWHGFTTLAHYQASR